MEQFKSEFETIDALKDQIKQQQAIIDQKNSQIFQLKTVIEKLPGSVYWKDKHGVYLGCNEFVMKMAGVRHEKDIVGKTDFDLPWKKYASKIVAIDKKVIKKQILMEIEEAPILMDAEQLVMLTNKTPLRDESGDVMGVLGVSVDITERKQMEMRLEEEKTKAELANQAKTTFLENMRHDIRTPLTGIVGCADLLKKEINSPKLNDYLNDLVTSSYALLNLLNEVLEASHMASSQMAVATHKFNLKAKLQEVIDLNKANASQKGIALLFEYDATIAPYVIGDATRIHRIVLELLTNALNFTERGQVKLSVQLAKRKKRDLVVKFVVEDTGIGIPKEKQKTIFLQFERLTASYGGIYKGTGLGLALVKQFVESIEGEVYVESELGKGTKFICIIPLRAALLEDESGCEPNTNTKIKPFILIKNQRMDDPVLVTAKTKNVAKVSTSTGEQTKILVVEDNLIAARVVKNTLSDLNCEVDIAENGKMALEYIEQHPYDLVLMDIGLPDMNGYEVTKRIRSHRLTSIRQIPVVALTAHADTDNQQDCLDAQINLVLSKPLTSTQAIDALNLFIPRRQKSVPATPESTQKPTEKVIDIEYAKTLLGGDETVVKNMLTMLVDSLPEEIAALQAAYQLKDWETLKAIAHKLKGGASYCGTLRLKSACAELETYVKSGLTDRIPELYQQLLAEIDAVKIEIHHQKFVD